jgi:hypothetical protein
MHSARCQQIPSTQPVQQSMGYNTSDYNSCDRIQCHELCYVHIHGTYHTTQYSPILRLGISDDLVSNPNPTFPPSRDMQNAYVFQACQTIIEPRQLWGKFDETTSMKLLHACLSMHRRHLCSGTPKSEARPCRHAGTKMLCTGMGVAVTEGPQ